MVSLIQRVIGCINIWNSNLVNFTLIPVQKELQQHYFETNSSYGWYELRCQKTVFGLSRPGPTHTGQYSHLRWLGTWNFGFRTGRSLILAVAAKLKPLISFTVTAKLIHAVCRFWSSVKNPVFKRSRLKWPCWTSVRMAKPHMIASKSHDCTICWI